MAAAPPEITQILDRRPATIDITTLENAESEVFRNIVDKLGVHHVFRKPFQHDQLISTVGQLVPME